MSDYLSHRMQRVVLNGQTSDWALIKSGVPQGSVLGPLLFLIYINDLPDDLSCNVKLFADDTSIFSSVIDSNVSHAEVNNDLNKIQNWAFQWKMQFNPDPKKSAIEVSFSRKINRYNHPPVTFNDSHVVIKENTKHLGMILDGKLDFKAHINEKIAKASKGIGIIKKLSLLLPRKTLLKGKTTWLTLFLTILTMQIVFFLIVLRSGIIYVQ